MPFWWWFGPIRLADKEKQYTNADWARIKAMGFTFVRMPIDLGWIRNPGSPDQLNAQRIAAIERGIDAIIAHDLVVIVDIHSTSLVDAQNSNFSRALEDPAFVDQFVLFWQHFSARLATRSPEMLIFEPMNEPVFASNPALWPPIQQRVLAAIRISAPQHTVVLTGASWSNADAMMALPLINDPYVIYNFHFYEPFLFTHQGANWSSDVVEGLHDLPYPSSPEAVAPLLDQHSDLPRDLVKQYGDERWDAAAIDARIKRVGEWAALHKVFVLCGEMGVYRLKVPSADRIRWHNDTRIALERYNIGWALWHYDSANPADSFAMVTRNGDGTVTVDLALVTALGLTAP